MTFLNRNIAILCTCFALILAILSGLECVEPKSATGASAQLSALEEAFYATGAELQETCVSAWVLLDRQNQTADTLTPLVIRTAKMLAGPAADIELNITAESTGIIIRGTSREAGRHVGVTAQGLPGYQGQREVLLTVTVEAQGGHDNLSGLEEHITGLMRENGQRFSITTCLSGWVSGKLEEEKMSQAIRQAFQRVQGHVEEGISGPHFVSYTGVTNSIDRSITVGKKTINLNMAMRHHSTQDRTYVTAASPVITREY